MIDDEGKEVKSRGFAKFFDCSPRRPKDGVQSHNLKVLGSNPTPATTENNAPGLAVPGM